MIQTMIGYGLRAGLFSWQVALILSSEISLIGAFSMGSVALVLVVSYYFALDTVGAETSAQLVNMQTSLAYIGVYLIDARRKSYYRI
jgi:hypothetical protein